MTKQLPAYFTDEDSMDIII